MIRRYLTNAQWERIENLCPGKAGDKGRHGEDNRRFVDAVFWILRTGAPWRDLPDEFGKWTASSSASDDGRRRAFGSVSSMSCVKIRTTSTSSSMPPSSAHINMRRAQKRGTDDEAIGRSRGGLSTKINAVVDALGNPLRFILTGGQVHDSKQAEALIEGFNFAKLLADKGYDTNRIRAVIALKGAEAVIPPLSSRSQVIPYDKHIYKERNLIERFFCSIKRFRRIATRYEKTAASFAGMLCLAGAMVWLS